MEQAGPEIQAVLKICCLRNTFECIVLIGYMGKACEIKFRFGADAFQDPPLCRSTSCGASTTTRHACDY